MNKYFLSLVLVLFSSISILADNTIIKQTFKYASKDGQELKLDTYNRQDDTLNKPCVIFMFGGGFAHGSRDSQDYIKYFESLVENGNVVVSIDYRLGFKNVDSKSAIINDQGDFIKYFDHTISIATEDLIDATNYVLKNAKSLNIDKELILVSGSSAGAITALHGVYAIGNEQKIAKKLPEGFRYAGVISFAGAIFSMYGDLEWKQIPPPMMLFHGSADKNVPYNAVELGYLGFYGSKYIVNQLKTHEVSYYFYDEEYAGHELSSTPMIDNLPEINFFIQKQVKQNSKLQFHNVVSLVGRNPINTNFTIGDYISVNFGN